MCTVTWCTLKPGSMIGLMMTLWVETCRYTYNLKISCVLTVLYVEYQKDITFKLIVQDVKSICCSDAHTHKQYKQITKCPDHQLRNTTYVQCWECAPSVSNCDTVRKTRRPDQTSNSRHYEHFKARHLLSAGFHVFRQKTLRPGWSSERNKFMCSDYLRTAHEILLEWPKREDMTRAGHVARTGERRGIYRVLVGKPEGKRTLGRPWRRW
jgi:hypothetical protein